MNGKINGHGKIYDFGLLRFEGGYINGKINGKGQEYFSNGNIRFEGEYIDRKRKMI